MFNLNHSKLDWGRITQYVTWEFISYNQNLPWVYGNKHICNCGKDCYNYLDLYTIKKLKSKPLNWKNITKFASYEKIYSNPEFPWDEETLISYDNTPLWFVEKTNYKWDMKKITKNSTWSDIRIYHSIKWDLDELSVFGLIKCDHDELIVFGYDTPPIDILCLYPK